MSPRLVDPDTDICPLPQCGFGADIHFDSLIASNPFVYRVYTPKERSPFEDDTDPFFIAPRFDEQFTRSPVDLPKVKFFEPLIGSYADVAQHMDWTTRMSSCYVSTSFNFGWAIWEAVRRYHQGVKKDVEIAIIDANALGGRAATAMQLLQKSSLEEYVSFLFLSIAADVVSYLGEQISFGNGTDSRRTRNVSLSMA